MSRIALYVLLGIGIISAIIGFASLASDIQFGIAMTGLALASVCYGALRLPRHQIVAKVSIGLGLLIAIIAFASTAFHKSLP